MNGRTYSSADRRRDVELFSALALDESTNAVEFVEFAPTDIVAVVVVGGSVVVVGAAVDVVTTVPLPAV